jgi:NTE family protein
MSPAKPEDRGAGSEPVRLGLALGGGGARGLAHVLMLEVLDELGVRPHCMAGTSIGAVFAALYSAGHSAREIRELVDSLLHAEKKELAHAIIKIDVFKWIDLIDPELGKGGLISADHFMGFLHKAIRQPTFELLRVPLQVVAADFWTGEQVVFDSGELLPALRASIALPGVFSPVDRGERILVDGGVVNPLPYDLLWDHCDVVAAIDVTGALRARPHTFPSFFDSIFHSIRDMGHAITREKLKRSRPDIYIRPRITDIRTLDFEKCEDIYHQAAPARDEFRRKLAALLA